MIMRSSNGRKTIKGAWAHSELMKDEYLILQAFKVCSCAQRDKEGALAHSEGKKRHVFGPSGCQGVLMCSRERKVH